MRFDRKIYRKFTDKEATEWGKINYNYWLPQLQKQEYLPRTPVEQFFRYYTQGIHYVHNRIMRGFGIEEYNDEGLLVKKEMITDGIKEISKHKLSENIVVYRFVPNGIVRDMKKWSGVNRIKSGVELMDKGFISTTLSIDSVRDREYATMRERSLFTIYVPKGTPCVYVDLISDMHENEIIFAPGTKFKVIDSCWFGKYVECVVLN